MNSLPSKDVAPTLTTTEKNKRLEEYRVETQDLTRTILALARARQKISLKIADVKETQGYDIENHVVEDRLSKTMLAYAKRIGLDGDMAKSIISILIEHSKIAQRKRINMKIVRLHLRSNQISNISIIGAGRMGTWFARYFSELGKRVILLDNNTKRALARSKEINCEYSKSFKHASLSDLVVVAVPISNTAGQIRKLIQSNAPHHKLRIIEISSIKSKISEANLLDTSKLPENVEVYSIHPLFGPSANSYSVNTMIQVGKSSDFVKGLFPHFKFFFMNWKDHDRMMSVVLTLPHSHALAFADILLKYDHEIAKGIRGPSFDHMLDLTQKVLSENPDVYYEIQSQNPFADTAIRDMISSLEKLRQSLKSRKEFRSFFNNSSLLQELETGT